MRNNLNQAGFLKLPNDSMFKTIAVALSLCLVCSIIVSTAATVLKPKQVVNKLLDKKKNILAVSGMEMAGKSIDELFEQIETRVVDMETGDYTDAVEASTFDQRKASKDPAYRVELDGDQDIAKLGGGRSKYASVYLVNKGGQLERIILPVKGYGLWSTMYGFLALENDAMTVAGITFYEHGETPGLGGEIENSKWQASWNGKQIFNQLGQPALRVVKGLVNTSSDDAIYQIDGLAGATLTSNGVSNMIKFWVGDNGFGPYLEKLRSHQASSIRGNAAESNNTLILQATNEIGRG